MLPEGYAIANMALLSSMRREWNTTAGRSDDWRSFRVRVGLRALAAIVTYGVAYNKHLCGQMQREGVLIDGQPYEAIRRPYFKASPVVLDRTLHPLDFMVERVAG